MTTLSLRPAGKEITYVLIKNDDSEKLELMGQGSLKLVKSTSRTTDIAELYKQLKKLITSHQVNFVLIKASVSSQSMTLAHLHTAEIRGICSVAATIAKVQVKLVTPAATFAQSGKVKDTLKNDDLFERNISGDLPKTKRDLALLVLNHLEKKIK
jgi:Holliday junction resolvasome RuvABC endonuclease subunit